MGLPIEYPVLSYLELARWIALVSPRLIGSRIERVYVPNSPEHPDGFFKREWGLDLYSANGESSVLEVSLRPQAAGFLIHPPRALRPDASGTRSGFDLSLHKHLTGGKITGLRGIDGDRIAILEVQNGGSTYELHLHFIPARPFGVLVERVGDELHLLSSTDQREVYVTPSPRMVSAESLLKIPDRKERVQSLEHYRKVWDGSESRKCARTSICKTRASDIARNQNHR